jgi:hypothetical protein
MITTHVSELAIDRLLAGELPPVDAAALRDHAGACPRCNAQLDDALVQQRAFAAARPLIALPRRRLAMPALAAATALAAAIALVVAWPRPVDQVRTKGTAIAGFFVAHGGQVRRGTTREAVVAGDRIELFTTTSAPGWFAAISVDAAGTRSVYVAPRAIEPGAERVLPLSIELDGVLGAETVTGVFCEHRFDDSSLLSISLDAPPPGCTLDRFTLVKVTH